MACRHGVTVDERCSVCRPPSVTPSQPEDVLANDLSTPIGWQCPVCKTVLAPHIKKCDHTSPRFA